MSDGKGHVLTFVGGVVVALIAGGVAYTAARVQADAAIRAAIETANASTITGHPVDKGIWVLGKGDRSIVYCEVPALEGDKEVGRRKIQCTDRTKVLTY